MTTQNATLGWNPANFVIDQCDYEAPLSYARLNKVPTQSVWRLWVLGVIFGIGFFLYIGAFILFLVRIKRNPLIQRSPSLLFVSGIGGAVALAYMYSRQFFDLVLVCPITYYVVELSLMVFFLPYLLRCYRAICVWNFNVAKASLINENNSGDNGKQKMIGKNQAAWVIRYRVLYSEKFLFILMVILCAVWFIIGIIVQLSAMAGSKVWDPNCQKRCNSDEGWALRVFVFVIGLMLIPYLILVIIMRNMNDSFSIRNELLALCLLSVVLVIAMIVLAAVPGLFWPETPYIGYVLAAELVLSFVISIVWPLLSTFTMQYNIDLWAKVFRRGASKMQFDSKTGSYTNELQTPATAATPQTQNAFDSNGTTTVQISSDVQGDAPVTVKTDDTGTIIKETKAIEAVAPTTVTSNNNNNGEFDFFLTNKEAKECFKQFLVREFSVENLMFYTEVQYYKKLREDEELGETATTIYETYVQLGAPFEINISSDLRSDVEEKIKSKPPPANGFSSAESAVYNAMLKESFPRFTKSKLYQNFKAAKNDKKKKGGKN